MSESKQDRSYVAYANSTIPESEYAQYKHLVADTPTRSEPAYHCAVDVDGNASAASLVADAYSLQATSKPSAETIVGEFQSLSLTHDAVPKVNLELKPAEVTDDDLQTDWNERFQALFESPSLTPFDQQESMRSLLELQSRFNHFALAVAKVLVQQLSVDRSKWIILPVAGLGVMGGEKFVVGKVFFKFARDDKGLFGHNDGLAQKAALNEIRAATALIQCRVEHLHTTLTSAIRLYGHCVIATALAPINNSTLVLGSDNAGRVLHDSSRAMAEMASRLAAKLNLAKHRLQETEGTHKIVEYHLAGDVEGHSSNRDGRFYMLDLGRLLPPYTPGTKAEPYGFLYLQFRPEYMRQRAIDSQPPLSSDAYTNWGRLDAAQHNSVVQQAYEQLLQRIVPAAFADIQTAVAANGDNVSLAAILHKRGVNMRLLGAVLHLALAGGDANQPVADLVAAEMVVRAVKQRFRDHCRHTVGADSLFLHHGAAVLQAVLGTGPVADQFWLKDVPALVSNKYRCQLSADLLQRVRAIRFDNKTGWAGRMMSSLDLFWLDGVLVRAAADVQLQNLRQACEGVMDITALASRLQLVPAIQTVELPAFMPLQEAEQDLVTELAIREAALGKHHPQLISTLLSLLQLYKTWTQSDAKLTEAAAQDIMSRLLEFVQPNVNPSADDRVVVYRSLADYCEVRARYADAVQFLTKAVEAGEEIGAKSLALALALKQLGNLLRMQGKYREAEVILLRALPAIKDAAGTEENENYASAVAHLALVQHDLGKIQEAEPNYLRSLAIREKVLGPENPSVGIMLNSVAAFYDGTGRAVKAEPYYRRAIEVLERSLGPDHLSLARPLNNVALLYVTQQRFDEAEALGLRSLAMREKLFGKDHPDVATALTTLAAVYKGTDRWDKAEEALKRAIVITEAKLGNDHPSYARLINNLANLHYQQGDLDKAEPLYRRSLELREHALGPNHAVTTSTRHNLGALLHSLGKGDEARAIFERCIAAYGQANMAETLECANSHEALGTYLASLGDEKAAEPHFRTALAIRVPRLPAGHPSVVSLKERLDGSSAPRSVGGII